MLPISSLTASFSYFSTLQSFFVMVDIKFSLVFAILQINLFSCCSALCADQCTSGSFSKVNHLRGISVRSGLHGNQILHLQEFQLFSRSNQVCPRLCNLLYFCLL